MDRDKKIFQHVCVFFPRVSNIVEQRVDPMSQRYEEKNSFADRRLPVSVSEGK